MIRRFHKMHGLGNDFVIFDAREEPVEMSETRARAISDRRTGIGCDQLIVLDRSAVADVKMRIFNADGSEVGACGNVTRCVSLLLGGDFERSHAYEVRGRGSDRTELLLLHDPRLQLRRRAAERRARG